MTTLSLQKASQDIQRFLGGVALAKGRGRRVGRFSNLGLACLSLFALRKRTRAKLKRDLVLNTVWLMSRGQHALINPRFPQILAVVLSPASP